MSQVAPQLLGREANFGRYRLLGRIAAGGMAEVWAAQLLAPGGFCKAMVIKRVLPELAENPSFLRMLMNEARVAARLSHTNICSVFELGEVEGEYYIAMEYLRGAPLTQLLKEGGALAPTVAVAIVGQACEGLHYAHEQRDAGGQLLGLVHRDVSPHNLFVTVDGIVKILDFGIAKVDDGSSERTEAGKVKGKLSYMSPEQMAATEIDRRSDVWSLGVVLWELLTGRRLFAGGPAQTVDAIRNARVPSLASVGVELPKLDAVLARAICRKEWRYANAAELKRAMLDAVAPLQPAPTDMITQVLWTRCGEQIKTHDKRFEHDAAGDVVERLPLRAESTQVSQEVYLRDGVDASALSDVLHDLEPSGERRRLRGVAELPLADTSPEVPAALAAAEIGSGSVMIAPRTRRAVIAAILAAAVIGMIAGVIVKRGSSEEQAPPRVERAEKAVPAVVPAAEPVTVEAKQPDPEPAPEPAPEPEPEPEPVKVEAKQPDPEPVREPAKVASTPRKKATPSKKSTPPDEKKDDRKPPPPKVVAAAQPGKLYLDAKPWATIYLDGKKLGPTPVLGTSISAGSHTIRAVAQDGRSKTMTIKVEPGGVVRRKVTW